MTSAACFHCGEPLLKTVHHLQILGEERELCCLGCYAVAQTIVENGLENYYLERRVISPTALYNHAYRTLHTHDSYKKSERFPYLL